MNCFFCKETPYHESTGCYYNERVVACGPCARSFFKWLKQHVNRWANPKRPNFYEAAFKFAPSVDSVGSSKAEREGSIPSGSAKGD